MNILQAVLENWPYYAGMFIGWITMFPLAYTIGKSSVIKKLVLTCWYVPHTELTYPHWDRAPMDPADVPLYRIDL